MITWNGFIFHNCSSNLMERVLFIHDFSMMFMFSILLGVVYIFFYIYFSGFYGSFFFENDVLENCWTLTPFMLLSFLIYPSLSSLYVLDSCFFCGSLVKIVGHQWYWSYYFNVCRNFYIIDSYMRGDSFIRLVDVDNRLLIPCFTPVRFICTSADVIHSWTVPSFGIKMDAIPGRLNQFCSMSNRSGLYFGQCSEICGANHSFMPIVIEVLINKDLVG